MNFIVNWIVNVINITIVMGIVDATGNMLISNYNEGYLTIVMSIIIGAAAAVALMQPAK